jgi:GAF domain-containing protein
MPRDEQVGAVFADLADSIVEDLDVVEVGTRVVHHCVHLLDVRSAGLMLGDAEDQLRPLAVSSEESRLMETFQAEGGEGPCVEAFRTGAVVVARDAEEIGRRWRRFGPLAAAEGIESLCSVPLHLRGTAVGSLNVFLDRPGGLNADDQRRAVALADMATIAVSHAQTALTHAATARQLQHALDSRVVIEQAKGVLVATCGIGVDDAFSTLRGYARSSNRRLSDVAADVVDGHVDVGELVGTRTGVSTGVPAGAQRLTGSRTLT